MTERSRWQKAERLWSADVHFATKLFGAVYTWLYPVFAVVTLGLAAGLMFVDAAFLLRRSMVWRLAAIYTIIDLVMWVVLLVRLFVIDARFGSTFGLLALELAWLLAAIVIGVVAAVQLPSLRGQIVEHLEQTQVLGVTRPYTRNRTPIPDRLIEDRTGENCALLLVGLERKIQEERDGEVLAWSRRQLFQYLEETFESSGLPWLSCLHYTLGDGLVVIVPRKIPKSRLIHPMLEIFQVRLGHHNRYAAPGMRLRARLAIHADDVRVDDRGPIGSPKAVLTALFDGHPLQLALVAAPETATVAVIVSSVFHDAVIHGGSLGIDPEFFAPVTVRAPEVDQIAWLHIPGHANVRL